MNVNDGSIREVAEGSFNHDDLIPVEKKEMTQKQKRTKKVSLHDHSSVLGKRLTNERNRRKITKVRRKR
jgi:hypothetical protein